MDDFFDDCDGDGLEWDEIAFLGVLSEEIAREKRDIERTRREWDDGDEDYWELLDQRF